MNLSNPIPVPTTRFDRLRRLPRQAGEYARPEEFYPEAEPTLRARFLKSDGRQYLIIYSPSKGRFFHPHHEDLPVSIALTIRAMKPGDEHIFQKNGHPVTIKRTR